jgi:hypothetical protein
VPTNPSDGTDADPSDIGRRQSLFREVNERIEELAEGFDLQDRLPILCECGSDDCHARIELTQAEYETVRAVPTRFAVLPGHEIPEVERVVARNERHLVVEKIGPAARVAADLDPRQG